ncbi:fibronectin/fibrinogen-binding protein [bacterium]|nr:fibronectin/fibrinogen-binding protein [bacterium]
MITFDSLTLKAFLKEESNFLTGARINKIQQPTRREFIFTLRNNSETRQFYVNINPQNYHLCFMSKSNTEKRLLEIPQKPPMFCMLLRKYLGNSRITKINQPEHERILEFFIETYNELGDKIFLCLAFELMGKHSNVVLYNDDTNIILGCAHNVGAEKSREREMYGGIPYIYPPKQQKQDLINYYGEIDFENLSNEFFDISNNFANQCKNETLDKLKHYISLSELSPCISKDFKDYSLFSELISAPLIYNSVNEMIDDYYAYYISKDKFKQLKTQYASIITQKLKKVSKSLKQMQYQIAQNTNSGKYRLWGDLIMANLYNLKDYTPQISVFDYENNKQIQIDLDKSKTLKDNANKFYKLYNKAKTSNSKLSELSETYFITKNYLEQLLYSINSAETIQDLFELTDEITETKTDKKQKHQAIDPIKIELENETRIFIGKNNKQNDYIISKLADDEDLWFHTKDCAGSHVLLKTQKLTDELILQCANLAKQYSSAKDSSKIGVIYTKRKYLRKPPKANLGYVTYKNEKEIIID